MGRTYAVPCNVNHIDNGWQTCDHFPYVPTSVVAVSLLHNQSHPLVMSLRPNHCISISITNILNFTPKLLSTNLNVIYYLLCKTNHTLHIASYQWQYHFCYIIWGQTSRPKSDSFQTKVCATLVKTRFLQLHFEHWSTITAESNPTCCAVIYLHTNIDQKYDQETGQNGCISRRHQLDLW